MSKIWLSVRQSRAHLFGFVGIVLLLLGGSASTFFPPTDNQNGHIFPLVGAPFLFAPDQHTPALTPVFLTPSLPPFARSPIIPRTPTILSVPPSPFPVKDLTITTSSTTPLTLTVPIIMYHHIAIPPAGSDAIRRDLSLPPAQFAAEMDELVRLNYHPLLLRDLVAYLEAVAHHRSTTPLPDNPLVLTFDDGYVDNYTNALPILVAHHFPATLFLSTGFVGNPEYVSWEQAAEMLTEGFDVEPHTVNHVDLTVVSSARALREILDSREAITLNLHHPAVIFSYPSGRYNRATIDLLSANGFWASVTTVPGTDQSYFNRYEMPRVRVHGAETLQNFRARLP